ncbi:MAG: YgcG family protein, partial [Burkholderiales bacterium]|nr:YgcG family protein [Burkholderiales bacterium]
DDGVLLLIAVEDREVRIEVGYGLEGVLPDAIAKRIIEEDITPYFRQGDFYAGVRAGVGRVINVIAGEPLPPPKRGTVRQTRVNLDWLFPAFVVLMMGRRFVAAIFGRFVGAVLTGALLGVLSWLVIGSLLVAVIIGVFTFVFGLFAGVAGGRTYHGWGGGWSSRGGFGGGGFSGGGGLSGGGGASGRW